MPSINGGNNDNDRGTIPMELTREQYREWVHSQVTNRLWSRIGTVGLSLLAVLLGVSVAIHTLFLSMTQQNIQTAVLNAVEPKISDKVTVEIIERSDLVEDVKDDVKKEIQPELIAVVENIMRSEQFTKQAFTILLDMLDEAGGPQDVILNSALQRAMDKDEADSIRAFSLQLYSILHAGKRTSDEVNPLREMFTQILTKEARHTPITPTMLTVILEHYPLGKYDTTDGESECQNQIEKCKFWDEEAINAILSILQIQEKFPVQAHFFHNFFSRVTSDLAVPVLRWIENNSHLEIAAHVAVSLMDARETTITDTILPALASYISRKDKPKLRRLGFVALSKLDHTVHLSRNERQKYVTKLWKAAKVGELEEAFSKDMLVPLVQIVRNRSTHGNRKEQYELWTKEQFLIGSWEDATISELVRRSIVGLLRADVRDSMQSDIESGDVDISNDWRYVLWPLVTSHEDRDVVKLYVAWSLRLAVDLGAGMDVRRSAAEILKPPPTSLRKNEGVIGAMEFALSECFEDTFRMFSDEYLRVWLTRDVSPMMSRLTSSVLHRDSLSENSYRWLETVFEDIQKDEIADHVLNALHGDVYGTGYGEGDEKWRRLAGLAMRHGDRDSIQGKVAGVIFREMARRAKRVEEYWEIVTAVEDVGVFAKGAGVMNRYSSLVGLKSGIKWIGTDIPKNATNVTVPGSVSVDVQVMDASENEGGEWYLIDTMEPVYFSVSGVPENVEVVVMNEQRSVAIDRVGADQEVSNIYLTPGRYAVAIRILRSDGVDSYVPIELKTVVAPHLLSPRERDNPVAVSESTDFLFDSGENWGEIWISVELENGTRLQVESQFIDDEELSAIPLIHVFVLLRSMYPLFYRDLLDFVEIQDPVLRDNLVHWERTVRFDENPIGGQWARTIWNFLVRPAGRHRGVHREFDINEFERTLRRTVNFVDTFYSEISEEFRSRIDEEMVRSLLVRFHRDLGGLVGGIVAESRIDTFISVVDAESGEELADDDDSGESLNAKVEFDAKKSREVLVNVVRYPDDPFSPGDRIRLRVVVE